MDGKMNLTERKEGKGRQRERNLHKKKVQTGKRGGRQNQPNKVIYQTEAKSVIKYIKMAVFFTRNVREGLEKVRRKKPCRKSLITYHLFNEISLKTRVTAKIRSHSDI